MALALTAAALGGCASGLSPVENRALTYKFVPDTTYSVYEVEITEPGVYALRAEPLEPAASNLASAGEASGAMAQAYEELSEEERNGEKGRMLQRLMTLDQLAKRVQARQLAPKNVFGLPVGSDAFGEFFQVMWSLHRSPAAPPAQDKAPVAPAAELGERVMQSRDKDVRPIQRGARAPDQAQLQPGRYLIRVAQPDGTPLPQPLGVGVSLVRVDESALDSSKRPRVAATPLARRGSPAAGATDTSGSRLPATPSR